MIHGRRSTDTALNKYSGTDIGLLYLALLIAITAVNYVLGFEITLSLLFLLPIGLATWHVSYRIGIAFSIASALIWLLTDTLGSAHHYENTLAPYLNTIIRLALFLAVAKLTTYVKTLITVEQRKSRTDPLTGLMNNDGFAEASAKVIARSLRHSRSTTFAYIDLDNLKQVNDELGHRVGDNVLRTVGETFLKSSRRTDIMGRLSEDDFVLILPETNRLGAQVMLTRLRARYAEAMQKNNWPIGFSIGVITYDLPPENGDAAVKIAYSVMQQARKGGANNTIFEYFPKEQQSPYQISYDE